MICPHCGQEVIHKKVIGITTIAIFDRTSALRAGACWVCGKSSTRYIKIKRANLINALFLCPSCADTFIDTLREIRGNL